GGHDEDVLGVAADEKESEERRRGQVEPVGEFAFRERLRGGRGVPLGPGLLPRHVDVGGHELDRLVQAFVGESGTQVGVALQECAGGTPQPGGIDPAVQGHPALQGVDVPVGSGQRVVEEQPFLEGAKGEHLADSAGSLSQRRFLHSDSSWASWLASRETSGSSGAGAAGPSSVTGWATAARSATTGWRKTWRALVSHPALRALWTRRRVRTLSPPSAKKSASAPTLSKPRTSA